MRGDFTIASLIFSDDYWQVTTDIRQKEHVVGYCKEWNVNCNLTKQKMLVSAKDTSRRNTKSEICVIRYER
jgi:hypothetical protein